MKKHCIKSALITGATSGIGYSFAKILARNSVDLIIASRNEKAMREIKQTFENQFEIQVDIIPCDLSDISGAKTIISYLNEKSIYPDLFINNAGSGVYGNFSETDLNNELVNLNLNIGSVVALSKYFLNMQKDENKLYGLLNVASTLAFRKSIDWTVYSAAKTFVLSFTRSLSIEYSNPNLHIGVLCPGKTDTHFDKNAGRYGNPSVKRASPDFVAEYALNALFKGKQLIIPGLSNKTKYMVFKYFPEFITNVLVK